TTTKLVVVLGPTASGKSSLGIALALHFHGEIVSADSRQVYRGLDIGTAKVTAEEQALVPHYLLDVASVEENYTVSQFQRQAIAAINDIAARGRQPFLVGGSPHYIQAIVDNLDIPAIPPQPALRAELEARPLADLLARLEELDPQSAAVIDRNNPRRVSHERLEALGLEYRFISRWLRGEFPSEQVMVERLKYAIHDFTRRQLTWFRKDTRIVWIEGNDVERAEGLVEGFLES